MWNIQERFEPAAIEKLATAGFSVSSTGGVARAEKYGCAAEFRKTQENRYQMTIPPSLLLRSQFTRLWDAGYQKFLLTDDGRKLPALASQLVNLRRFNEELRTALGVPTYYNEALGSTCRISAYDRIKSRGSDAPEPNPRAKSAG